MQKRNKLEIIKDILTNIRDKRKTLYTPLLRKSNLSTSRFQEYYDELKNKNFIIEEIQKNRKFIFLSDKGIKFIEKYNIIKGFIDEFEL
jgi:predicted transcriptional regulator